MVEAIEVDVGQTLAGEVADGQAPGALQRGEPGVVGEGVDGGSLAGSVGQDAFEEPEGASASDPPAG